MTPTVESAAALSQLLAVLLLFTAFSRSRLGALRRSGRRAAADGPRWRRALRRLGSLPGWQRAGRIWELLSHLMAGAAIFFFAIVLIMGNTTETTAALSYSIAALLALFAFPGLLHALLDDVMEHAAGSGDAGAVSPSKE